MRAIRPAALTVSAAFFSLLNTNSSFCQDAASGPLFSNEIGTTKKIIDLVIEFIVKYSFQVLGGIIVILLGWFTAKIAAKLLHRFLEERKVDVTISKFTVAIVKLGILGFAVLIALGEFGITIAPFIAGLSVIGFGTSFALQGPLSNYAAGATLIFTKPFKVGDIIEVVGVMGEVEDMALARTQLKTVDGTKIVIPNKHIIGEVIHNYTDHKKVDINVGISYDSDVDKAISLVRDIVIQDKRVSQAPEPKVGISQFADSSINIYARVWCKQAEYWDVMFGVNKKINDEFRKAKITIPYPQRDVHIKSGETA